MSYSVVISCGFKAGSGATMYLELVIRNPDSFGGKASRENRSNQSRLGGEGGHLLQ